MEKSTRRSYSTPWNTNILQCQMITILNQWNNTVLPGWHTNQTLRYVNLEGWWRYHSTPVLSGLECNQCTVWSWADHTRYQSHKILELLKQKSSKSVTLEKKRQVKTGSIVCGKHQKCDLSPGCNPLWLTGLKAPTNWLTNLLTSQLFASLLTSMSYKFLSFSINDVCNRCF